MIFLQLHLAGGSPNAVSTALRGRSGAMTTGTFGRLRSAARLLLPTNPRLSLRTKTGESRAEGVPSDNARRLQDNFSAENQTSE